MTVFHIRTDLNDAVINPTHSGSWFSFELDSYSQIL